MLKIGLAPGFALGVDDPARQNSPGLEDDLLWSGFISLEHQFAGQVLTLVGKRHDARLSGFETLDCVR